MLQRPRGLDHNQENPYLASTAGPSHHNLNLHKTPARPRGKGPLPVTGGKPTLTSTIGRGVLGKKDGNQGKGGNNHALLFSSKPSTSTSCQVAPAPPTFKTPAPKPRSLRPLADLQTPATALRPKRAPVLVPSPEVEREVETDLEEAQQEAALKRMIEMEVEYAGPSATDYEEPYEPECEVTDYTKANYGEFLRTMSFSGGTETHEEWEARDAFERQRVEFVLDDPVGLDSDDELEGHSKPLFPIPASAVPRRAPLVAKLSSKPPSTSSSVKSTLGRRPPVTTGSTLRQSVVQSSASAPATAVRRTLGPKPPATTPLVQSASVARGAAPLARKPLAASTSSRPTASLVHSTRTSSSLDRSRSTALNGSTVRKASTSSLRSTVVSSSSVTQKAQFEAARKAKELRQAEEKKLGAFGVTDGGAVDDLLAGMDLGYGGFNLGDDGEDFKLDFDSD